MFTSNAKSIAASKSPPQLDDVGNVVTVALCFEMHVCVFCFTEQMLEHWRLTSEEYAGESEMTRLSVLDSNRMTLAEWKAYLQNKTHDLTILSGAHSQIQTGQLSKRYIEQLIGAVPTGIVMLA